MNAADRAHRLLERYLADVLGTRPLPEPSGPQPWREDDEELPPGWSAGEEVGRAEFREDAEDVLEALEIAAVLADDELAAWRTRFDDALAAEHPAPDAVLDSSLTEAAAAQLQALVGDERRFEGGLAAAWELGLVTAEGKDAVWRQHLARLHPDLDLDSIAFGSSGGMFLVGGDEEEMSDEERAEQAVWADRLDFERGTLLDSRAVPLVRVAGVCVTSVVLREHAVELTLHAVVDAPSAPQDEDGQGPELPTWLPEITVADDAGTDYGPLRGDGLDGGAFLPVDRPLVLRPTVHVRTPAPDAARVLHLGLGGERIDVPLR